MVDSFFDERVLSRIKVRRTAQISPAMKFSLKEASRSSRHNVGTPCPLEPSDVLLTLSSPVDHSLFLERNFNGN